MIVTYLITFACYGAHLTVTNAGQSIVTTNNLEAV
jgi:hypothetical protein